MTAALEGGEWSAACPGRTLPPGNTQYPLYRRLRVRKISPLPGFDPRTVQPVVSRYTDWATRPTMMGKVVMENTHNIQASDGIENLDERLKYAFFWDMTLHH